MPAVHCPLGEYERSLSGAGYENHRGKKFKGADHFSESSREVQTALYQTGNRAAGTGTGFQ